MTAQSHEVLILDGKKTSMAFCPPLPEGHPRVLESATRNDGLGFVTSCWRGYVGTWEVKGEKFYLVGLRGKFRVLPGGPIFADWFSGVLRIPRGERLHYVHMGFGSVYEEELHITIEKGEVVGRKVIDNRGKKHDPVELALRNLPGGENKFPGDGEG
ncbi:MAG: hypothetical protein IPK82_34780 [Polyangiaceae bacterium]|nr:hypothetical protein [Polyangiaceae bacterium]